jgi:hypothetical protein
MRERNEVETVGVEEGATIGPSLESEGFFSEGGRNFSQQEVPGRSEPAIRVAPSFSLQVQETLTGQPGPAT